jgi:hypothetical protein
MEKRYPFKFLDAYTRQDNDIFFGRDEEVAALYEMVYQTDLLLVYGASGTGKTSLIQCGLASRFQSYDWLALNIRRGGDLNQSLEAALVAAGGIVEADANQSAPSVLADRFKAIYLRYFKPLYLIFDQLEELYILGSRAEQAQFIQTIQQVLRLDQPVKVILSIREEYLGQLYEFERAVPSLLRKKLRVEPMNLEKVKAVIQGVGSLKNSNVEIAAGEGAAFAEEVFARIRGDEKTLSIQLPYLQVFLDKLYRQLTKEGQAQACFTRAALAQMAAIGDVLQEFLDEQVLRIAERLICPPADIWRVLSPFVT